MTPGPAAPGCRAGVRQVVVRAAEAGQGELEGFQFAEGGVQRGGDGQAGDRRGAGAGQQPGGVGGRDDHGGQPGPGGRGLGEQGGEDRAGGRLGAGACQAEAAERGDVDVDGGLGVVAADAEPGPCRAAARAGQGCSGPGCGTLSGSSPGAALPSPSASGAGRASYRSGTGLRRQVFAVRAVTRAASWSPAWPGGGRRRAARRRALMTSGSGGVSGASVLGGPGRGR